MNRLAEDTLSGLRHWAEAPKHSLDCSAVDSGVDVETCDFFFLETESEQFLSEERRVNCSFRLFIDFPVGIVRTECTRALIFKKQTHFIF